MSELSLISQPNTMTQSNVTLGPVPASKEEHAHQHRALAQGEEPTGPYFYYRDQSHLADPDPSMPVTVPGRIPTFPAKLFAILSRPDLADIISWMPHGRSWKVHKPREFEVKVIPSYFDHAKFSSFIRQANGWGFKRVCTKGADRNSHYHELFLRGVPHLIKFMRRPVSGSKVSPVPQQQTVKDKICDPDFYKISEEHPLPEFTPKMLHSLDESSFLNIANNRMLGRANRSVCSIPPSSTNTHQELQLQQSFLSFNDTISAASADQMSYALLQDSFSTQVAHQPLMNNESHHPNAFLLPRMSDIEPQTVTSCASSAQHFQHKQHQAACDQHCPVRQEEKELDPLTILLNDVYEEGATQIDDPVIQSLISDITVPPPSSLCHMDDKPSTPVYEPNSSSSNNSNNDCVLMHYISGQGAAPAVVSPVEEKKILELAEPHHTDTDPLHAEVHDHGLLFEDPFAGGLLAKDFFYM